MYFKVFILLLKIPTLPRFHPFWKCHISACTSYVGPLLLLCATSHGRASYQGYLFAGCIHTRLFRLYRTETVLENKGLHQVTFDLDWRNKSVGPGRSQPSPTPSCLSASPLGALPPPAAALVTCVPSSCQLYVVLTYSTFCLMGPVFHWSLVQNRKRGLISFLHNRL